MEIVADTQQRRNIDRHWRSAVAVVNRRDCAAVDGIGAAQKRPGTNDQQPQLIRRLTSYIQSFGFAQDRLSISNFYFPASF